MITAPSVRTWNAGRERLRVGRLARLRASRSMGLWSHRCLRRRFRLWERSGLGLFRGGELEDELIRADAQLVTGVQDQPSRSDGFHGHGAEAGELVEHEAPFAHPYARFLLRHLALGVAENDVAIGGATDTPGPFSHLEGLACPGAAGQDQAA